MYALFLLTFLIGRYQENIVGDLLLKSQFNRTIMEIVKMAGAS